MMNEKLYVAKEIQCLVGRYLQTEMNSFYTDIQEWNELQESLSKKMSMLIGVEGDSPTEEAEFILAILMGYTIFLRNPRHINNALKRAERILPLLENGILKCHLAVFCYGECYDDGLAVLAQKLINESKQRGNGEEIRHVEQLFESMKENSGITY